jgi:hypothetical protein
LIFGTSIYIAQREARLARTEMTKAARDPGPLPTP